MIVQGILRTVEKDDKQKHTKRKPTQKDKTTSKKETPYVKRRSNDDPDHNEHLILIDTDTGVYYDHLLRNRNGVLIMNDVNLLNLTDSKRSYFKDITMIVAVHLPQLNKLRQKRHELTHFFDTSKYPIGDNPNKAATAYIIDKMNLQKLTSNPLKWHPDGDTIIKDYVTINHLMWCMNEAKKRRFTSTPNIYCSWTSKENDSYKLEGIFDGLEEYVEQFIYQSIPLEVITPPILEKNVHIDAEKHNLMNRLGNSPYLDNLISSSNNIPIRLNLTAQKQPRRCTYSVIMRDKNDPTIPNTLCLAKTRDIGLNEKEQPSNPMTNIKFEFMHYVWEACTPNLSLLSRTIPPTHGQELMYFGVFPATMGWHKDHLTEDNRGILKGSNTIIVSLFDTMLFVIKDDVTGIQEEIELKHLDVLILGPHTDKSSKHMVKFKPLKKRNKNTNEKDRVEQCRLAITYRWATDRALFHYDVVDREGFPYNYAIGELHPPYKNCANNWVQLQHTKFFNNLKLVKSAFNRLHDENMKWAIYPKRKRDRGKYLWLSPSSCKSKKKKTTISKNEGQKTTSFRYGAGPQLSKRQWDKMLGEESEESKPDDEDSDFRLSYNDDSSTQEDEVAHKDEPCIEQVLDEKKQGVNDDHHSDHDEEETLKKDEPSIQGGLVRDRDEAIEENENDSHHSEQHSVQNDEDCSTSSFAVSMSDDSDMV